MLTTIQNAIHNCHRLQVSYEPGSRVIEPHAVGYGSDGQLLLRAFQVSGVSASGEHHDWKLLRLDKLMSANNNGQVFDGPRPGYRKGDKAMKGGIIAEL